MPRRRAIFRRAFALELLALAAAGCLTSDLPDDPARGFTPDGRRLVTLLTMQLRPTFDDYFFALIADFEAAHPDVKVEWLDYPFQNYETKLVTSFMGGSPPDVINIGSETLRTYVDAQLLQPVGPLLKQATLDGYVPALLNDGGGIDGEIFALPWYLSSQVTVMNKRMFAEAGIPRETPPELYEDVPEICRTMRAKTDYFGFFQLYTEAARMRFLLQEAGVPLLTPDRRHAAFNTPRGVEVFKFWTDLYRQGLMPSEAVTATHRRQVEMYKAGRLALLTMGPEFLKQVEADAPDIYAETVVGPRMHWADYNLNFVTLHVLTVSARARHPELAAELAAFVTNAENQLAFCRRTTIIPSSRAALEDDYFTRGDDTPRDQARLIAARQAARSGVYSPPRDTRRLYQIFEEVTERVCLGKLEAAEGLAIAEKVWNEVLAEQR